MDNNNNGKYGYCSDCINHGNCNRCHRGSHYQSKED